MKNLDSKLVFLKRKYPFCFILPIGLLCLSKNKIVDYQKIHFCTHKTAISVFRGTNNRLAPDIKTGIHEQSIACLFFKFADQAMGSRICLCMDGLDPCREIVMGDGLYITSFGVKPVP